MVVLDVARGHGHRRDRGSCSLLQFQLYTKSRDVAANSIVILIQISYHHHNWIPKPNNTSQLHIIKHLIHSYGRLHDMTSICGRVLRSLTLPKFNS